MYPHDNVVHWDDSAVKEAFDNAKKRFWAKINGLPCNISLPDPDIYIDDVDWNLSVCPELVLDSEREAMVLGEEERYEEVVILGSSLLLNQSFSCTGWGDAEAEIPKPSDPNPADQGWDSNLHENQRVDSWEQHCAPVEHAKECECQNGENDYSWGWNQREHQSGDLNNMGKGRTGGNGKWGTWDEYNRKRENMALSKTSPAYHGNGYQMNRGKRGNFTYERPYVDNLTKYLLLLHDK
ncbi:uncharacterized protein LOC133306664 [Gastrolobium bilobum]|uniref:uncharacterized protein LOC133306664 n=1 Tax=Gastrolobium bilobum TaxID=150636 RepID=UPI002AB200B2|nr:uncharacterized protein LOC133306664 [Gastrolobium bilobum]